jgi:hypothetical protein
VTVPLLVTTASSKQGLRLASSSRRQKATQLMPSFACDCCTFACDFPCAFYFAPLLFTTQPLLLAMQAKAKGKGKRRKGKRQRKGKRRKGKRGALFLCTFACDYSQQQARPMPSSSSRRQKTKRQKSPNA